ncbi:polyisoprenoid-binding protein [Oleomonas cavernae]|uniref:Polyisoprenoid-binding protein n=1 Tax=Oleomonas cavernae TaxID=2320859 RepID=A0A418WDD9_9PROT|nr:YceI family protein [Oleomonas cavernae]RJF87959.1 polyisoprenoid-binding protein [Oleomonas cavernae]
MKKAAFLAAALFLAPLTAVAQDMTPPAAMPAGTYKVDPTHASLIFKINHFGLSNYAARFKSFDAAIEFDPKDVTKSKVTAKIKVPSLETDFPNPEKLDFNKELSGEEKWLNDGKFPTIGFVSTRLELTGATTGKMHGDLTMLGVTKPVVLDVTFNGGYAKHPVSGQPIMGFSATGSLKRSDWGLTTFLPALGDEVSFAIEAEFPKAN